MPTLSIGKTYADGDVLTEADLDLIRDDLEDFFNVTKIDTDNIQALGIATANLANGILSADSTGRAKMADGFLSADATGRGKMADGFVNRDKLTTGAVGKSNVLTVTAAGATALDGSYDTILSNAALGAIELDLPAAASHTGRRLFIKHISATSSTNTTTVDPNGVETIDGDTASIVLSREDEVLELESDGTGWQRVEMRPNRYQTKILTADVTSATSVAGLSFSNLVVGRVYELKAQLRMQCLGAGDDLAVTFSNNSTTLMVIENAGGGDMRLVMSNSIIFKAAATSLACAVSSLSGTARLTGNNTMDWSWAQLIERNDLNTSETTAWT